MTVQNAQDLKELAALAVLCPKCNAAPGEPCRSIRHSGLLRTRVYQFHKKRRTALYVGARVLSQEAVPVRPTVSVRPEVGLVDSPAKGL